MVIHEVWIEEALYNVLKLFLDKIFIILKRFFATVFHQLLENGFICCYHARISQQHNYLNESVVNEPEGDLLIIVDGQRSKDQR